MVFGVGDTVELLPGSTISTIGSVQGQVQIDRVKDVSIKAFPCPKVNDKGLTGAWWWINKIAIAVSLWATYETWIAAKEEYKIGKRYYELGEEQCRGFFLRVLPPA